VASLTVQRSRRNEVCPSHLPSRQYFFSSVLTFSPQCATMVDLYAEQIPDFNHHRTNRCRLQRMSAASGGGIKAVTPAGGCRFQESGAFRFHYTGKAVKGAWASRHAHQHFFFPKVCALVLRNKKTPGFEARRFSKHNLMNFFTCGGGSSIQPSATRCQEAQSRWARERLLLGSLCLRNPD